MSYYTPAEGMLDSCRLSSDCRGDKPRPLSRQPWPAAAESDDPFFLTPRSIPPASELRISKKLLQPLFHRTLRVNLPPSAFDESPCSTPQHSPSCSPRTARSAAMNTSSKASSTASATFLTAARIVAAAVDHSFHPLQHQAVHLSPDQQKSYIEAKDSVETDESGSPLYSPVQHQAVQQPCQALAQRSKHDMGTNTVPLPVVDLAAALVVISDDPLLSTGACLPAIATSPTTPTTPPTPTSFISLDTTTSNPHYPVPPVATMSPSATKANIISAATSVKMSADPVERPESMESCSKREGTALTAAANNQQSMATEAQHQAALCQNRSSESTRKVCGVGQCPMIAGSPSQSTSATHLEASDIALADTNTASTSFLMSPGNCAADGSDQDTVSCSTPIAPVFDLNLGSAALSSTEALSISAPFLNISPTDPSAPRCAASATPRLIMHGNDAFDPNTTCDSPCSQFSDSDSLPAATQSPLVAALCAAPRKASGHNRSRSAHSLPLLGPFPRTPQSSVSIISDHKRQREVSPDSPTEPSTPRPRALRHIWRPHTLPAPRIPAPCSPIASVADLTINSQSSTCPLMHRVMSTGSCASSSYATSCATVTPYAWLPCDRCRGRSSNATSTTTISTVADFSGSLPRASPRSGSTPSVPLLDTLTFTPAPPPLFATTGLPASITENASSREPQSKVPVAAPVTPTKVSGSFFHLPDPVSHMHAAHASSAEVEMVANLHMLEASDFAASFAGPSSLSAACSTEAFTSPFRHTTSWPITSAALNVPRYPLPPIASVPMADHPSASAWGLMGNPFDSPHGGHFIAFSPVSAAVGEGSGNRFFQDLDGPHLNYDPSSPASPRCPSSPGSPTSPVSPQYPHSVYPHLDSPGSPTGADMPPCFPHSPTSPSSTTAPGALYFHDGSLHVSSHLVLDCDAFSDPPSEAPSTPPSNISISTPSSSSSQPNGDTCNAFSLSPRSDIANDSPVAKALEHMHEPLTYPDSEDDYVGGHGESPPGPPIMACMDHSRSPFTGTVDYDMRQSPSSLFSRSCRSPSQMIFAASTPGGSIEVSDTHNDAPASVTAHPLSQSPSSLSLPGTTNHQSKMSSSLSQTPLLDSISDDIDLSDAKLQRMRQWTQRHLPIHQPQTLSKSPPASPPLHTRTHSILCAVPRPVPEPFALPVVHWKSYSCPSETSNLDLEDLMDVSTPVKASVEASAAGLRDNSAPLPPPTPQPASAGGIASMRGGCDAAALPGADVCPAMREVVPAPASIGVSMSAMSPGASTCNSGSVSGGVSGAHGRSRSLLLSGTPASDEVGMQPNISCGPASFIAATFRGGRGRAMNSASSQEDEESARHAVSLSSFGASVEGGANSNMHGGPGRCNRLARRARGASAPQWLSQAWGGERQSRSSMGLANGLRRGGSGMHAAPVATSNSSAAGEREGFVARRLSGWGFGTARTGQVRRKLSLRPEVMQYLGCASSFFCGSGIQEEEKQL